jgi:D-alanine-D-alanine ligase
MGGTSAEREISIETGLCVATHLAPRRPVKPVVIRPDGSWRWVRGFLGAGLSPDPESWSRGESLPVLTALSRLREDKIAVVFNALHGPGGEDGSFQGLLQHAGIPFTGPDVTAAAVTMDKCLAKYSLQGAGFHTPRFFRLPRGSAGAAIDSEEFVEKRLPRVPFPWIVKPKSLGSSVGVKIFRQPNEFLEWARELRSRGSRHGDQDLSVEDYFVEEFLSGRELTCGVLETGGPPQALPPVEIRPKKSRFFDEYSKYTPGATDEICPAPLDEEETAALQSLAVGVHRLFGCEPLSRTDVIRLDDGTFTVLELNTLPGMTSTSLIPLSAEKQGIPLEDLFDSLLEHALRRAARHGSAFKPGDTR